jgi:hypothetical protein
MTWRAVVPRRAHSPTASSARRQAIPVALGYDRGMRRPQPRVDSLPPDANAASAKMRIAAPLPCDPGTSPFHIKGIALRGLVHMIERRVPGGVDLFADSLDDPRLGVFLRQPFLAASRYDLLPLLPLNMALARALGTSLEELAHLQGTAQARYDGTHTYRVIVSGGTLADLAQRLPRLGAQYYDFGAYEAHLEAPGRVVVRRTGMPAYVLRWFTPMHIGYVEEVVRMMGARTAAGSAREARPIAPYPATPGSPRFELVDTETVVDFA